MNTYANIVKQFSSTAQQTWSRLLAAESSKTAIRGVKIVFAPVIFLGSAYGSVAKASPFVTGFATTGLKTTAADIFAQKVVEKKEEIDWRRNAMFTTFGFLYLGGFQYYLYNVKFAQWCGAITRMSGHLGSAPFKTFLDQFIHHPLLYFPTFYALKATIEQRPLIEGADSALARYRSEIFQSCQALWSVWVPAQIINFTFVPRHLRIPFVAATSFGWTIILSVMQGAFDRSASSGAAGARPALAPPTEAAHAAPPANAARSASGGRQLMAGTAVEGK
jgi:hypothetical protein